MRNFGKINRIYRNQRDPKRTMIMFVLNSGSRPGVPFSAELWSGDTMLASITVAERFPVSNPDPFYQGCIVEGIISEETINAINLNGGDIKYESTEN